MLKRCQYWHLSQGAQTTRSHTIPGSLSQPFARVAASSCSVYFMEKAGGPNISCINVYATPSATVLPLIFRAYCSLIHAGCPAFRRFLLGQTERWAQFRSAGPPLNILISASPPTRLLSRFLLSSISLHCPSNPFACSLSSPPLSLFPSFSLSPSVVVDWVSECLWQLCVVCNRAERLVWIQRWENLFMWEMHRWR